MQQFQERPPHAQMLRERRRSAGLSQAQLAVKAGVSVQSVQLAEQGVVSDRMAERLARALGAPAEDIRRPAVNP